MIQNLEKLVKLGVLPKESKTLNAFTSIQNQSRDLTFSNLSEFILKHWDVYKNLQPSDIKSLSGKVFEILFIDALLQYGIHPIFYQTKIAFIPNIDFDIALYSQSLGPIIFSLKTSLRERYKQADLEAVYLKYVHRKAKCYLISLDEKEVLRVQDHIKSEHCLGIDNCFHISDTELENLFNDLRENHKLYVPGKIDIIQARYTI